MSNNIESVLKFNNYIVKKVNFKVNEHFSGKTVSLVFSEASDAIIKGNELKLELTTKIFNDAEKNDFPFEMEVVVDGIFEAQVNIKSFIPNAVAILYPYVRAIVSTYTAQANINPLILPAININKLLEEENKNK